MVSWTTRYEESCLLKLVPTLRPGGGGRKSRCEGKIWLWVPGLSRLIELSRIPRKRQLFPEGLSPTRLGAARPGLRQAAAGVWEDTGLWAASCLLQDSADEVAERSDSFFPVSSFTLCSRAPSLQQHAGCIEIDSQMKGCKLEATQK